MEFDCVGGGVENADVVAVKFGVLVGFAAFIIEPWVRRVQEVFWARALVGFFAGGDGLGAGVGGEGGGGEGYAAGCRWGRELAVGGVGEGGEGTGR